MLNGSKILCLIAIGNDNHTARVLTRCTLDTGTALAKSVGFSVVYASFTLFKVFFNEAESCFIGNGTYRTRFKNVGNAEKLFGVSVGVELIFARKVKVDIGRFVALEAEEGFKRNVVAVSNHRNTAMRTVLWRQIKAGADLTVEEKLTVLTLLAKIERCKRHNL